MFATLLFFTLNIFIVITNARLLDGIRICSKEDSSLCLGLSEEGEPKNSERFVSLFISGNAILTNIADPSVHWRLQEKPGMF